MANLTVVAKIVAKKEKLDFVKAEMLKLLEPTRAEEGCIQYDLHQDNDDPCVFIFFENWKSAENLETHINSAHSAAFQKATDGCIAEFILNKLTLL